MLRILLVDDEPGVLEIFGSSLRSAGYETGVATNAEDALERFRSMSYDLVLTDRIMPGADGEKLACQVKELSPCTPVIIMTGLVPDEGCRGADAVLRKPFSQRDLFNLLERFLGPHAS